MATTDTRVGSNFPPKPSFAPASKARSIRRHQPSPEAEEGGLRIRRRRRLKTPPGDPPEPSAATQPRGPDWVGAAHHHRYRAAPPPEHQVRGPPTTQSTATRGAGRDAEALPGAPPPTPPPESSPPRHRSPSNRVAESLEQVRRSSAGALPLTVSARAVRNVRQRTARSDRTT